MTQRATEKEYQAFLAAHGPIDYLDLVFVDMCGTPRGKRLPASDAAKVFTGGVPMPQSILFFDATGRNEDVLGRGFSDGDPDVMSYPIAGSLVPVPWADAPQAQVMMSMTDLDGAPSWLDARHILDGVSDRLAALGLTPVLAPEFEFYLLDPIPGEDGQPRPPINPETGQRATTAEVYALDELDGFMSVLSAVNEAAMAQNVPASAAVAEFAPGQYEINLSHEASALAAGDHAVMLRHLIGAVARQHKLKASFMAKPFLDQTGSGLHVHCSMLDGKGANIFDDGGDEGSDRLRHAIGGLQKTMGDAMAIFAPNINAYRRFGPNLFVPVNGSWGYNNRSVALRIPAGPAVARRVEHRVAGADANPYLVLAALLAGIHYGLENKIDPGPPADGNVSGDVDENMPLQLLPALDRLQGSAIMRDYLGADYVDTYVESKRLEFEKFLAVISPRELEWYL